MEPVLEVKNIDKSFVGVHACDHVSFKCYPGRVHVLQGENGAGKSTVLKIISGLYHPDGGEIYINGEKVTFTHTSDARKKGIAMVYQEMTIFPELTVAQNVFINQEQNHLKGKTNLIDEVDIINKTLELAGKCGIEVDPYARAGDLPIANQQMVEILKALATDPKILILDEPTSTLTNVEVDKLYEIVQSLLKQNKAIIFISHRMKEVFRFGNDVTILKDGQLVDTVDIKDVTVNDIIKMMVGRELKDIFPPKAEKISDEEIFRVENLNGLKKIDNVSLTIHKGEVLCISALDGQGQMETLQTLAGVHKHTSGRIYLNGKEVRYQNVRKALSLGIGYVPENRKTQGLCLKLSVRDNIALSSLKLRSKAGFINLKAESAVVKKYVDIMNIRTPSYDQLAGNLSGGNQQKVSIGKNLASEPKVLILNEPTRGIDVEAKQEIYKLIRELADSGVAVLVYTSDMMEVIGLSDRVMTMYEGRITSTLEKNEVNELSIMQGAMNLKNNTAVSNKEN
jgi:ABC-type sugar transport system ATPase subunit